MKRDWDLLRKQLTDIEEEKDIFSDIPLRPEWSDKSRESWEEFELQEKQFLITEARIAGHLEMLINEKYVEGIFVERGVDGHISYGLTSPRLTMAGYDLLDTMRSSPIWESIKLTAKSKSIELTFETIKVLAVQSIKQIFSSE